MYEKLDILVLVLVMLFMVSVIAFAEEASEDNGSKFEQVLLKKGSMIVKEYITVAEFPKRYGNKGEVQAATLTDVETGEKYNALRIEIPLRDVTCTGVLDLEEVDDAITTIKYFLDHCAEMKNYTEVCYTTSTGLTFGGYVGSNDEVSIEFGSSGVAYYSNLDAYQIIRALQAGKDYFASK